MKNYEQELSNFIYSLLDLDYFQKNIKGEKNYLFHFNSLKNLEKCLGKSEGKPIKIFKYCPVNKYTVENLEKEQIYLSGVNKLNDPLEGHWVDDREGHVEWIKNYCEILNGFLKEEYSEDFNLSHSIDMKDKKEFQQNIYVASLTEDKENDAMWGNYSDGFKGILLEYDFEDLYKKIREKNNVSWQLQKVIYNDKCPSGMAFILLYESGKFLKTNDSVIKHMLWDFCNGKKCLKHWEKFDFNSYAENFKFILRKKEIWKYEQEWRLIHVAEPGEEKEFVIEGVKPSNIYLGSKYSNQLKVEDKENQKHLYEKILEIAKKKSIEIHTMNLSNSVNDKSGYVFIKK